MRVPPPMPCAISDEPVDGAGDGAFAQRARHMDEAGVEDERLRLAEGVDRGVQEADEERGVELHRAGRVEQHARGATAQLAPPPHEIDRRPAMGDAAMDRAPKVEPPAGAAAPASAAPAAPACAGRAARRARGPGRFVRVGDVADVAARERMRR